MQAQQYNKHDRSCKKFHAKKKHDEIMQLAPELLNLLIKKQIIEWIII